MAIADEPLVCSECGRCSDVYGDFIFLGGDDPDVICDVCWATRHEKDPDPEHVKF